jgi:hypothetical protein
VLIRFVDKAGKSRVKVKCPICNDAAIERGAPFCRPCMFAKKKQDVVARSERRLFDGVPCRSIVLTRGYVAWVDEARFSDLCRWKWNADIGKHGQVYAFRRLSEDESKALGRKTIRMHRQIKSDPKGMYVDHRDGDGLHNWDANLRVATAAQNAYNKMVRKPAKSGLIGAHFDKRRRKYFSTIGHEGQTIYIGMFDTAEEASEAYKRKAAELHGEFSVVNRAR